ncbi:acyltransferase [Stakelama sp. CBK3Z-3]|uniref:Acyltransferase n=1 Tax=Stakelama flava TaxID=2860338 RepID=A0ABS6XI82_9SPHN|nr:acyltransferase [Stakelama flava]MBW4329897.1 acyltransferase [Stakelama flava]
MWAPLHTGFARLIERRQNPPLRRLNSVQCLRALAVLMVVSYHLTALFPDPAGVRRTIPAPLYFGYAGVDLFFVISGFIITHVTRRDDVCVRQFVLKRLFRILPFYWMVTALLIALWVVFPEIIPVRGNDTTRFFVNSLFLLPQPERPVLGVGWTLEHELQFYALIALLLLIGAKGWSARILMAIFGTAVGLHVIADTDAIAWDWKIFSLYSFQFALGIVAYRFNALWRVNRGWPLTALAFAAFLATSIVVTPMMGFSREVDVVAQGMFGLLRVIGYGVASALLLLGVINLGIDEGQWHGRLTRVIIAIGDASFMIYLTHNLIIHALALFTRQWKNISLIAAGSPIAIIVIVALGIAVHRFLERPLLKFFGARFISLRADQFVERPGNPSIGIPVRVNGRG